MFLKKICKWVLDWFLAIVGLCLLVLGIITENIFYSFLGSLLTTSFLVIALIKYKK